MCVCLNHYVVLCVQGKSHIHPDHPDYVSSVFPIEHKRKPCTLRCILNRDSDKVFDCSRVETDEEEKMHEVESEF